MVRGSRRTRLTGSTLVRLLAELTQVDVPEPRQDFAEGLSRWLRWSDAISLSAALSGSAQGVPHAPAGAARPARSEEADFIRVRTALAKSIAEDTASTARDRRATPPAPTDDATMETPADFAPYRLRYVTRQQAMEANIGPLRDRVRDAVARASAPLARLAAVDAVMEQALAAHERAFLSTVPTLLEQRFERLRQAHRETAAQAPAPEPGPGPGPDDPDRAHQPEGWLHTFRNDMRSVLLAELDIRLQPVEGLLEALRTSRQGRP